MRKTSIALVIALLCTVNVFAQTTSISGTVRNSSTKEVVPAVTVSLKGSSAGTFTNDKGNFRLTVDKLPAVLIFSSVGYESQEVNVTDASQPLIVDFLSSSSLGQEVVVSANRTPQRILESPVTIERMNPAVLRSLAAPTFYEGIGNLKGVDVHTASLTFRTVTTRGFVASGNNRLNQLIDGMDNQAPGLNFAVGGVVGLTDLDVDNVELLSGASSALYGSGGMNGTLLINSKNPFKYQGLSVDIKQGIMHVDGKQRSPSPYYNWDFRYAKAFKDKFAFKIAAQFIKANDWQADDYRNKQQIGVLSKVAAGDRQSDPNYNGINVYGDETSLNMKSFSQVVVGQGLPPIIAGISQIIGHTPSAAELNAILASPGTYIPNIPQTAPLLAGIGQVSPFYFGLQNNKIPDQNVSRTGYNEKDLVDYNTINMKGVVGLYYKITPGIEASWNTYFGTGTTVYTGADRYSLRNLKIAQHKLEVKAKNWFVRGYTTQENAGDSYNASALGGYINETWSPSSTWFGEYVGAYLQAQAAGAGPTAANTAARAYADRNRPLPGTAAFDAISNTIKNTPIAKGGALFLDKSDLWAAEGQLNFSDALGFSDKVEVLVGAAWKQYVMNSRGTIFADTLGPIKINETGGYVQLRKKLFNDLLTLTAAGRYDKQTNFDGKFTPRFTAVIRVAKDNNVRLSYQTAYRFPTNQDQYISLITGAGILIGCLPSFQDYYHLNSNPGYTAESILAYRASGDPSKINLLQKAVFTSVKPESVSSYEIGYKGVIGKKLLIDAYYYYSEYKDFLLTVAVGQPGAATTPTDLYSPFTTTNISYKQNSTQNVKATGWGIGAEYQLPRNFTAYGNIFSDELRDVPTGTVTYFNAPKYRWNLGLRNENVYKNIGFNIVGKWQDKNYYEGTFISGTLPSFIWFDGQITYHVPKTKSLFRIGGTNLGNSYYRTGFGSPYVGGLYYVSWGYNVL